MIELLDSVSQADGRCFDRDLPVCAFAALVRSQMRRQFLSMSDKEGAPLAPQCRLLKYFRTIVRRSAIFYFSVYVRRSVFHRILCQPGHHWRLDLWTREARARQCSLLALALGVCLSRRFHTIRSLQRSPQTFGTRSRILLPRLRWRHVLRLHWNLYCERERALPDRLILYCVRHSRRWSAYAVER